MRVPWAVACIHQHCLGSCTDHTDGRLDFLLVWIMWEDPDMIGELV